MSLAYHKLHSTTLQLAQGKMAEIHTTILIKNMFSAIDTIQQM